MTEKKSVKKVKRVKKNLDGGVGFSQDVEDMAKNIQNLSFRITNAPQKYPANDPRVIQLKKNIETFTLIYNKYSFANEKYGFLSYETSPKISDLEQEIKKLEEKLAIENYKVSKSSRITGSIERHQQNITTIQIKLKENKDFIDFLTTRDQNANTLRVLYNQIQQEIINIPFFKDSIVQLEKANSYFQLVIEDFKKTNGWNLSRKFWDNLNDVSNIKERSNLCVQMQKNLYEGFTIIQQIYV